MCHKAPRNCILIDRRSCTLCRKHKIRCNREIPCNNCVRTKKETCTYDNQPPQLPPRKLGDPKTGSGHGSSGDHQAYPDGLNQNPNTPSPSLAPSHIREPSTVSSTLAVSSNNSLPAHYVANLDVGTLQKRIKELEEQLSKAIEPATSLESGLGQSTAGNATYLANIHSKYESRLFGSIHIINRGLVHKNRLHGQSHWSNGIAHVVSTYFVYLFANLRDCPSLSGRDQVRCQTKSRIRTRQKRRVDQEAHKMCLRLTIS